MLALVVGTGKPHGVESGGEMVSQQRLACKILSRMFIAGLRGLRAQVVPVASAVVTPAEPHESDKIDLLVVGEFGDQRRQLLLHRIVAMILQDPKFSLNPVMTVGKQIVEAIRIGDRRISGSDARKKALGILDAVHIREPERVFGLYPHELSGGVGQRVMIGMMVVREPDLLIADEPTSALDVTVRTQVLSILDELVTRRGMGLIFISHDLNLVSKFCDRVIVMYAGRIVESIEASRLSEATHPYTRGLLSCLPHIDGSLEPLPVLNRDASWAGAA